MKILICTFLGLLAVFVYARMEQKVAVSDVYMGQKYRFPFCIYLRDGKKLELEFFSDFHHTTAHVMKEIENMSYRRSKGVYEIYYHGTEMVINKQEIVSMACRMVKL